MAFLVCVIRDEQRNFDSRKEMLIGIMIPEIARVTREQVLKRIATSMVVGAVFDGVIGAVQEKNPIKEGGKGAIVGGVGQGASLATREFFNGSDKICLTVGVLASVAARYAMVAMEPKEGDADLDEEESD